ncbi:chitinase 3 [Prunus yedoensis var. nudiflora]|uniref:Chitinase 3 n=1 Tax=Prunus yedoensis var. nudiflora TaxID=2094558 RepID=A0A314XLC9_PRUYE|nr:chitinase 3 [Prunus yedoensis var. nudiflora]
MFLPVGPLADEDILGSLIDEILDKDPTNQHFCSWTNVVKAGYWYSGISFPASAVDSTLYTHLFVAFADVDRKTNQVIISPQDQPQFSNFTPAVQQRNPFVKTFLSIGGASASSRAAFASMASQPSSRKTFIHSSINISRSYNFHGLEIDWEFPATATLAILAPSSQSGGPRFFAPGWSPNVTGPPASLYNPISPISGDSGITAWLQAAENGASTVFNSTLVMDYSYTGKTWIGYDDTQYAKGKGLVGYFAWNVGIDVNRLFHKQLHAHGEHIRDTTLATFPINKKIKM